MSIVGKDRGEPQYQDGVLPTISQCFCVRSLERVQALSTFPDHTCRVQEATGSISQGYLMTRDSKVSERFVNETFPYSE